MKTQQVLDRLKLLQTDLWSVENMDVMYGLDLSRPPFRAFLTAFCKLHQRVVFAEGKVSRFAVEHALQDQKLFPIKLAAMHFGMTTVSFLEVLDKLELMGVQFRQPLFLDQLYDDSVRFLYRITPFSYNGIDSNKELHILIKKTLGISVEPVFCRTAAAFGCQKLVDGIDAVTLEPLCLNYAISLNVKPISLIPDYISVCLYDKNVTLIEPFTYNSYCYAVERLDPAARKRALLQWLKFVDKGS